MAEMKSLDDLLNSSVEDLVDLKEFKPLPVGSYLMRFKDWEKSEDPAGVRLKFTVVEIVELENPDLASEVDMTVDFSQLYMFFTKDGEDNSMGQGQLKAMVKEVFAPLVGGDSLAETLSNAKGMDVAITVSQRADKKEPTRIYNGIKTIVAAG